MTDAEERYTRDDANDETPLHPRCGGVSSSRKGDPPPAGGRRQPSPGCRAGGLTKPLSDDMSAAICLTDKLLAVSLVGWYHPRGAWEAQDQTARDTERSWRTDDEER